MMSKQSNMISRGCKLLFLAVFMLCMAGCSSSGLVMARMNMNAAQYLNPDVYGKASPVLVSFYELTTPVAFKQAKYYQLQSNPGAVLGESLLDKQTVAMRPGHVLSFPLKMASSVKYVGITAGYRNIDQAKWRAVIPVAKPDKRWYKFWGHTTTAKVDLLSQGIKVQLIK